MSRILDRWWRDESAATSIEYGLIAAFIMVALVSTLMVVGSEVRGPFTDVEGGMKKRVI